MLLAGIFPPVTTPYYPDGQVYFKKLEHNLERYSKTPVAGIVVLGSTGEAIMLSDQEQRDVLKVARDVVYPNKVLIAGTGSESAIETLRLTEYAAELGYDVALVRTPHYYKKQMQPANMLAFYRTVGDRASIPIMLYSVPSLTGYDLPAEVAIELADHPNIIGLKESGGDIEKIKRMVERTRHVKREAPVTQIFEAVTQRMIKAANKEASEKSRSRELVSISEQGGVSLSSSVATAAELSIKTRQKQVGFQVLAGAANKLHASLSAGATGAVLAFADPAPTACYEVYAAWKEGDDALAQLKQERIAVAGERLVSHMGIPALKYAMDLNGYFGGPSRLPLLPLTAEEKADVERLMADIRN
jgi:dihydrodipicolinate synthase/N-acetylneuraminate lyase